MYAVDYGSADVIKNHPYGGNGVTIVSTNKGKTTLFGYWHLDEILIEDGSQIKAGQLIGTVGATVRDANGTTNFHLHFVGNRGGYYDPVPELLGKSGKFECVVLGEEYPRDRDQLLYPVECNR